MQYKLYTDAGNFRAFKALIAAEYNNINIQVHEFDLGNPPVNFLEKSPLGRVPVLETATGEGIRESNAIARFIAKLRLDSNLLGTTLLESAQVDSWMDFSSHNIELPATLWFYPILGFMPMNASVTARAKADLSKALRMIDDHLQDSTYLVGHNITLADIAVVAALVYPFKFVADSDYRSSFPNVVRWFSTCVNQKKFMAVIGKVDLATAEINTASVTVINTKKGDKDKKDKVKQSKPQVPKEEKAKVKVNEDIDEDKPTQPKKEEHPFKVMDQTNKSPFSMDAWKKTYSNCSTYEEGMETFWNTFDSDGWSIFRGDYNYNDENKILFMTSNLVAGFIQRTDEIRKWLFGTMTIRGEEGKLMKITAYFLIRGDSIEPLLKCNDDAECYTWTKVKHPFSPEDKAKIFEYWTSETMLEGESLLDSRVYK